MNSLRATALLEWLSELPTEPAHDILRIELSEDQLKDRLRRLGNPQIGEEAAPALRRLTGSLAIAVEVALASERLEELLNEPTSKTADDPLWRDYVELKSTVERAVERAVEKAVERADPVEGGTSSDGAVGLQHAPPRRLEIALLGWPRLTAVSVIGAQGRAGFQKIDTAADDAAASGATRSDAGLSSSSETLNWGYQAVLEILALLLTAKGGEMGRDQVAGEVWPDMEIDVARKQLYPAVSHLRKLLRPFGPGNPVELRKGVYRLNPEWPWRSDIGLVDEAIASTAMVSESFLETVAVDLEDRVDDGLAAFTNQHIELLESAWRATGGDFLQGVENSWIKRKRNEFQRRYRTILRRLAWLRGAEDNLDQTEEVVRTLVASDVLQEDAHLALMRIYVRRGRPDLARRQYERMVNLLVAEVGLAPMDETVREAERLLG